MAVQFQANLNATFKPSTWPPQTHFPNLINPIQAYTSPKPRTFFPNLNLRSLPQLKLSYSSRKFELRASAVAADSAVSEDAPVDESDIEAPPETEVSSFSVLFYYCYFYLSLFLNFAYA